MSATDYTVTISGITFRPISAATLMFLSTTKSPLITGGDMRPEDFAIFAWMHAAPIGEVHEAISSGNHERQAVMWAADAPPEIFAVYTAKKMCALAKDIGMLFADQKTGFIPFPTPSCSRKRLSVRGWISTFLRYLTGSPQASQDVTSEAETP